MAKKMTEEEKAERKAKRELDKLTEEANTDKEAEKAAKAAKKEEKKYGKRVHVVPETVLHCRGTFLDEVLGGWPSDPQIFSTYVASQAPDAMTFKEEVEAFGEEDVEMNNTYIFPKDKTGKICVLSYQFRGFLITAAQALKRAGLMEITAHEKVITQLIKISASPKPGKIEKWIPLHPPKGTATYLRQRPIRVKTPQGENTALASSEALPADTTFEFYVHILSEKYKNAVLSWLEYGWISGLLQWRNSGCGQFRTEIEVDGKWIPVEEA